MTKIKKFRNFESQIRSRLTRLKIRGFPIMKLSGFRILNLLTISILKSKNLCI